MDNLERSEVSAWVQSSVDLLAPPPAWEPNPAAVRARFQTGAGIRPPRRYRYALLAVAAALLAAVATVPPAHVFAQQAANNGWRRIDQIWDWLTIVRRPAGGMRLADAVKALQIRQGVDPGSPVPVASASEAAQRAGFAPRLPDVAILSAEPQLSVTGPRSFTSAQQLTLRIATAINAAWSSVTDQRGGTQWASLTLSQAPPPLVAAPQSFNLASFTAAALQDAGMRNLAQAQSLAALPTTLPALLTGYVPRVEIVSARVIDLRTGRATLIQELDTTARDGNPVVPRITLLWSVQDRAFLLTGVPKTPPGMLSLDLAAALAGVIDLANSFN